MNNQTNNTVKDRKVLPFFVEFVKFSAVFVVIISVALIALHMASAAMP